MEELLENENMFMNINEKLSQIVDLDLLLNHLISKPKIVTPNNCKNRISAIVCLRQTLIIVYIIAFLINS